MLKYQDNFISVYKHLPYLQANFLILKPRSFLLLFYINSFSTHYLLPIFHCNPFCQLLSLSSCLLHFCIRVKTASHVMTNPTYQALTVTTCSVSSLYNATTFSVRSASISISLSDHRAGFDKFSPNLGITSNF